MKLSDCGIEDVFDLILAEKFAADFMTKQSCAHTNAHDCAPILIAYAKKAFEAGNLFIQKFDRGELPAECYRARNSAHL